jgi:hypothetical protein
MSKSYFGKVIQKSLVFQYLLLFIIAIIIWQIFYPGLLSPDSLAQYEQSLSGNYVDWHPPIMAIILRGVIKLGGGIGVMILIQCLAALFGMRSVLSLLLRLFSDQKISKSLAGIVATGLTILFLLPFLTPYMFFSVIFWTDAWLSIVALWIISYVVWIFLNKDLLSDKDFVVHIILLTISSSLMVLIRHNSITMLPAICIIIAILSGLKLGKKGLAFGIVPLILAFSLNPIIYALFNVSRTYTGNTVLASDLTVMLRHYPELSPEFPLAARHREAPTVLLTEIGGVWNDQVEGKPCPYLNKKSCDSEMPLACFGFRENTFNVDDNDCYMSVGHDNKVLKDEYFKAVTTHPLRLLKAKVYLFRQMLHPRNWNPMPTSCEIASNSSGLKINDRFTEIRENLCYLNHQVGNQGILSVISGIHPLWLALNILLAIYFGVRFLLKRDNRAIFLFLLSLIPLSYYLSYILASTTPDYRFMYPSTLIMQVLFFSFITSKLPAFYRKEVATAVTTDSEPQNYPVKINGEWSAEEKAKIVIEGLKGRSEAELCREYNLDPAQYAEWRDEFLRNAHTVFRTKQTQKDTN